MKRYLVVPPIPDGYQWWKIADTQSEIMPNFEVATFAASMPFAEEETRKLCRRLNKLG